MADDRLAEYQKDIRAARIKTAMDINNEAIAAGPWEHTTILKENTETALAHQEGGQHYKNMAIQPIEYCQKNQLRYCESNVVKYVSRHREKGGMEDLRKAIHNIKLLMEIDYGIPQ